MALIRIAGLDGSLRRFGGALMTLDTSDMSLKVDDLILVKTDKSKEKQVRTSSDYLDRALMIRETIHPALLAFNPAAIFVEVPSGGQDFRAVMGFGIVIGIYASCHVRPTEVSPSETKMAAVGTKTASKEEIIEWAVEKFPDAKWLTRKQFGKLIPIKDNEHLADSVAIAHAGIRLPAFRQTISILNSQAA